MFTQKHCVSVNVTLNAPWFVIVLLMAGFIRPHCARFEEVIKDEAAEIVKLVIVNGNIDFKMIFLIFKFSAVAK